MGNSFMVVAVIGYVLAAICLIISIYLYFKLQIPQVIKRLRTIPSKQRVAVKEQAREKKQSSVGYSQRAEELGLFDFEEGRSTTQQRGYSAVTAQSRAGKTSEQAAGAVRQKAQKTVDNTPKPASVPQGMVNATSVLGERQARPGTVVLNGTEEKGTVVLQAQPAGGGSFQIIENIVFLHTDETI